MTYVTFAQQHKLTPTEAVVLPALFERAAQKTDRSLQALIIAAHANTEAGEYLAETARKVAKQLEGEI